MNPIVLDQIVRQQEDIESLRQQLATLKAEIKSIGKAIDDPRTDLTMTMSEVIIDQKQQLAAAHAARVSAQASGIRLLDQLTEAKEECDTLRRIHAENIAILERKTAQAVAACKLKDEALEGLIDTMDLRLDDDDLSLETRTAFEALAIQPDDSVLKAWLGEPVAWKHDDPKRHDAITDSVKELLHRANSEYMHRPIDKTEHYTIPLYSPKGLK